MKTRINIFLFAFFGINTILGFAQLRIQERPLQLNSAADYLREEERLHNAWKSADDRLSVLMRRGKYDPCDVSLVKDIETSAQKNSELYGYRIKFYQDRKDIFEKRAQDFLKEGAGLGSYENFLGTEIANAERDLADFKNRRSQLVSSLGFVDTNSKIPDPIAHLDRLIEKCRKRMDDFRREREYAKGGRTITTTGHDDAVRQVDLHTETVRGYYAEQRLWGTVYKAISMRLGFECQRVDIINEPKPKMDMPTYSITIKREN